jgi:lysophospholipase L1-like esterase
MQGKLGGREVYCSQVAKELKKKHKRLKFFFKGIASNRTYHLYDRLTEDCINLKPDVIVMLIGVNDAWENYVPEQYPPLLRPIEPHLKEIYRRIKTELPNAKLVTLLPFLTSTVEEKQPFHTVLDRYVEIIRTEATGKADEIIDLQPLFDEAEQLVTPALIARDSVHPTSMGHSVIASAVLSVLK